MFGTFSTGLSENIGYKYPQYPAIINKIAILIGKIRENLEIWVIRQSSNYWMRQFFGLFWDIPMAFRGPVRTLAPQAGLFRLQTSSVSANAAWTVVDCWLNTVALQRNILCDDAHAYAHAHAYDDDRDCYFFVVLSVVIIDIVFCQLLLLHLVFNNIIIRYHNSTIYHEYHHLSLLSPWISRSIDAAKQSKNDSRWKAWEGLNTVESKDTVTLWKSYGKMAHCLWKWWWFMKIVIVPFAICSSRRLNVTTCRYKGKNMLMLPLWADFHHFSGRRSWER